MLNQGEVINCPDLETNERMDKNLKDPTIAQLEDSIVEFLIHRDRLYTINAEYLT